MMSARKLSLAFCLLLASMPPPAPAADLTARQLVDRILASKAKYRTLAGTVEKTLSEKRGTDEWHAKSKRVITWRWRAKEDVWFLELVEQGRQGAVVTRYAKRKDCLKMFESVGGGRGSGKVASFTKHDDRHMGVLTPNGVLWDPLGYSWDAYVKGAQKLVRKESIYYLTSSVIGGRAVVTIAVDPDHGYLPTMYDVKYTGKRHGSMRYSASDFREVDGLWVPSRYAMAFSIPDGKDIRGEFRVTEIAVNRPIPDEKLDFQFPRGAQVSYETKLLKLKMALERLPKRAEKIPAPLPPVAAPSSPVPPASASYSDTATVPEASASGEPSRPHAQPTAADGDPPGEASRWTLLYSIVSGFLLVAVVFVLLRRAKTNGREGAQ